MLQASSSAEAWTERLESAYRLYDIVRSTFDPSVELDEEKNKQDEVDKANQQWADAYGDPNDPEVAAKIDATAEAIKKRGELARKQNDGNARTVRRR